jgi:Tol biopolymer transport system component
MATSYTTVTPVLSLRRTLLIPTLIAALALVAGPTARGSDSEAATTPTTNAGHDIVYDSFIGTFLLAADGSSSLKILGSGTGHPDWSPDGSRIALEVSDADGWDIWTVAADGSDGALLVDRAPCPEGDCLGVSNPAWSPDGESMAYGRYYVAPGDVLRSDVEVMDVATGETRVIASAPPGTVYEHPRWTPDGESLVYTFTSFTGTGALDTHTGAGIAIVSTTTPGAEPRELTDPALFASYPDVRASDGLIVFNTYDLSEFAPGTHASNLYTIQTDGSELMQLTHYEPGEMRAGQPTWTPDGDRIIFTLGVMNTPGDSDTPNIASIDANGDDMTIHFAHATHARLRPTGTSE